MKKCIVVIPAFNEECSIGKVIRKIPREVADFDMQILVVNDGSTDDTVKVSKDAGANYVLDLGRNRGLGAAVRAGLQEAYRLGADYAIMIDADDEYPAEFIPELLKPMVARQADYVMGSRFKGQIKGMKLHRRLGNYFFTMIQIALLRKWIWDGQSGFRGFTRDVIRDLRIIHDYNYAQVMTLNIVRQGYVMQEVAIPYRVRTTGTSFIKFWPYMKNVLPAIVREICSPLSRSDKKTYSSAQSTERMSL